MKCWAVSSAIDGWCLTGMGRKLSMPNGMQRTRGILVHGRSSWELNRCRGRTTSEVRTVDKSSIGGLFLALGGILFGLFLEGGRIAQIVQPTAAMIVFGGTLGAVLLQFPLKVVFAAVKTLGGVFVCPSPGSQQLVV